MLFKIYLLKGGHTNSLLIEKALSLTAIYVDMKSLDLVQYELAGDPSDGF